MRLSRYAVSAKALHRTRRSAVLMLALVLWGVPSLQGQILGHFNPLSASANGIHLYGASVSSMYAAGTGAGMGLGLPVGVVGGPNMRVSTIQASAAFGWARTIEKSSISASYSPGYVRGLSGTKFDSTTHAASFSWSRPLGKKWTANSTASGIISDFSQLPFGSTRYGNITASGATFDDLAAAILRGRSDNIGLNQAMMAAPLISSPEQAYLYGGRILSVAAGMSAAWAYSSRSSLNLSLNVGRAQSFGGGSSLNDPGRNALLPRTTSGIASVGWSYSLNPRTSVGVTVSTGRSFSQYFDGYGNQAGVTVGRTLTNKWFVQATAGAGWIAARRQTFTPTTGPQMTFSVSTGYRLYAQTIMATFSRSVSDVYGLGASATESGSGAWSWKRPGSTISVSAGFGYARLIGSAFGNTRSWNGSASVGKALNAHMAISGGYSYTRFPMSILTTGPNLTQSAVMASLSWSPSERR